MAPRPPEPRVSVAASSRRRGTHEEACSLIVDPYKKRGWGWRVAALGASGSGKSYFSAELLDYALRTGSADYAFVYDHKDPSPSFRGTVRRDPADLAARPLTEDEAAIVVFHQDGPGDPNAVAELGFNLGLPCIVDIDELCPDAVTRSGQEFIGGTTSPLSMVLRAGRSRGCSGIFATQFPQKMPTEATDLCESMAVFRLQRRGLRYAEQTGMLDPDIVATVATLRMGEFVLIRDGECDGAIYGPA